MKLFRNAVFAVALVATSFMVGSCRAQAKPESVVEYNLGSCGGRSFTVQHAVIGNGKLKFTDFMSDPQTVKKDEDNVVLDVVLQPKDKDGNVKFKGTTKYHDSKLEINGLIRDNRLVALMTVDGDLGHVYYGQVGTVDDMVKVAEKDFNICVAIHNVSQNEIPAVLAAFLMDEKQQDSAL